MRLPSGDHAGCEARPSVVSASGDPPSASTIHRLVSYRLAGPFIRETTKTTRLPSDEISGAEISESLKRSSAETGRFGAVAWARTATGDNAEPARLRIKTAAGALIGGGRSLPQHGCLGAGSKRARPWLFRAAIWV